MRQVLFTVPILKDSFSPDGLPVYGFGAMLFVTFIVVTWWGSIRAKRIGMEPARFQDFAIWVFISGIIGARVLYMIQYAHQFPDRSVIGLLAAFFRIWEGGIIFYGSALGGAIGYGLFYWFVMRRLNISGWRLADVVAPLLALGLAIGRIGCYLNGCCWGQVACEECVNVPLGAAHFPLLPAHARVQLVAEKQLQSTTGFTIRPRDSDNPLADPRAVVAAVEPGSPAALAGIRRGDRVVQVNGRPNGVVVEFSAGEQAAAYATALKAAGGTEVPAPGGRLRILFDDFPTYLKARIAADRESPGITFSVGDRLDELVRDWPRGKSELVLAVERDGRVVELPPFTPRTVGLYPTQLYETVSMLLLVVFLLAYYPYRRHDGQLLVLVMLGYAVHRFINESLRIEPVVGGGLTLSQWGSVVVFVAAVGIELFLWRTMPSRWQGEPQPAPPAPPGPASSPA